MKKIYSFLLLVMVLCTCTFASVEAAEQKLTCVNGLVVTATTWQERTFDAKYPTVYIPGNPGAAERINLTLKELIHEGLLNAETAWTKTDESTYGVDYVVTCPNVDNLLSINFSHYVYDGLDKPHFFFSGITFDTTTGKMLGWRELVRPEDADWFNVDTVNTILREEEKLGSFYLYSDSDGVDKMPNNYYLDNYGMIHFQWAPGEIAKYTAGVIDISMNKVTKYSSNID